MRKQIKNSKDVYDYIYPKLCDKDREYFIVLHLDTKNRIIKDEVVSIGTLNSSIIHPREVFKLAVKESAYAIILVHNHPSGDPEPSEEDKQVTERLIECGNLLGIHVLDHIVVGGNNYWSSKEN